MSKIPNWSKTVDRTVADVKNQVDPMYGVVKAWEHDLTDNTVKVTRYDDDHTWYGIELNGKEPETARSTLTDAQDAAVWLMRENPDGIAWV